MAAAVHHHPQLLLRPPPRQPGLIFSPRSAPSPPPTRLCSSLLAPTGHLAVAPLEADQSEEFVVVTIYKLVPVEDPRADVAAHLQFLQGRDIHGRIYMNGQGINAQVSAWSVCYREPIKEQYSGPRKDAMAYADWLRKDHRFSYILVQISPALSGHAFPRLKLRYK